MTAVRDEDYIADTSEHAASVPAVETESEPNSPQSEENTAHGLLKGSAEVQASDVYAASEIRDEGLLLAFIKNTVTVFKCLVCPYGPSEHIPAHTHPPLITSSGTFRSNA